jgi:toxin ParE1/3/4
VPGSPSVSKTNRAKRDLAEVATHYGEESLELELRFLAAAEKSFDRLLAVPEKGARRNYAHPRLQTLRMWPIPDFPRILIFYRRLGDGIEIVRVIHSSRDIEALFSKKRRM